MSTLKTEYPKLNEISSDYRIKIHTLYEVIENSWPKRSTELFRDGVDIVLNYWARVGFIDIEHIKPLLRQTVGDLEQSKSKLLVEGFGDYLELKNLKSPK